MRVCSICGGYCDPGDLVGGKCYECREEEEEQEIRKEWNRKMLAQNIAEHADGQLVLNYAGRA